MLHAALSLTSVGASWSDAVLEDTMTTTASVSRDHSEYLKPTWKDSVISSSNPSFTRYINNHLQLLSHPFYKYFLYGLLRQPNAKRPGMT